MRFRTLRTVGKSYLAGFKKDLPDPKLAIRRPIINRALLIWIEFVFCAATQPPITTSTFAIALNIVIPWNAPYLQHEIRRLILNRTAALNSPSPLLGELGVGCNNFFSSHVLAILFNEFSSDEATETVTLR